MGIEIERKFLVSGDAWRTAPGAEITQGYLCRSENHSVRVRLAKGRAWLAVKGRARKGVKQEFEYPIPPEDARAMLELCPYPLIEKTRHEIAHDGFTWEVDVFKGANQGLVVAEIELEAPDQSFPRPAWIGAEVTDDPRYLNANLAVHPFSDW